MPFTNSCTASLLIRPPSGLLGVWRKQHRDSFSWLRWTATHLALTETFHDFFNKIHKTFQENVIIKFMKSSIWPHGILAVYGKIFEEKNMKIIKNFMKKIFSFMKFMKKHVKIHEKVILNLKDQPMKSTTKFIHESTHDLEHMGFWPFSWKYWWKKTWISWKCREIYFHVWNSWKTNDKIHVSIHGSTIMGKNRLYIFHVFSHHFFSENCQVKSSRVWEHVPRHFAVFVHHTTPHPRLIPGRWSMPAPA